jgi:hypothetical protein
LDSSIASNLSFFSGTPSITTTSPEISGKYRESRGDYSRGGGNKKRRKHKEKKKKKRQCERERKEKRIGCPRKSKERTTTGDEGGKNFGWSRTSH